MSLDQRVCTWNPPLILEEMKSTQYTATGTDDIQFDRSHDRGYGVGAVENGDKYFLSYDGTSTMNGSVPIRLEGTWRFTSGTGSLARLQGSGTYKAKPTPDGKMVFEIEGEYALSGKHGK